MLEPMLKHGGPTPHEPDADLLDWQCFNKGHHTMTKSLEVISEAVRNPKHPFRKVDNQPKKPRKHRYERRKIKEYLHLGEWVGGEVA